MDILNIDFETYYDRQFSLSKMTTEEYIRDPQFETIGVAVKRNEEETVWFSGTNTQTKRWLQQWDWDNSVAVAHNAMFDMAILNWRYDIRPKRIADTLSMLRAIDGPHAGNSLAKAVERYGLGEKGDEVINALGKRRLDFTDAEMARYGEYCINDVELTQKLFAVLAPLTPVLELRLIDLTIRMFTEPTLVLDKQVLTNHVSNVRSKKEELMAKLNYDKSELMSNPKLAELLEFHGVSPPMKISPKTGKAAYAFAKSDEGFKALLEHENPQVQAIVAARLGVKSTLEETRTERFINIADRGLLPVPLRYYAAHTGRWGGDDKVNLQNLPRKSPLKKSMLAPEGYVFIDCDSSQIEARTLAWLAGQDDLVEAFDKGEDVYKIMASSIYEVPIDDVTDDQRFVGKTTILGCFGPDTKVLTNNGWKHIVEVQATDMLWDGEEWVTHEGVIPQGEKEVLTAQGLTATLDHEILTVHGWREWYEVATNPSLFQSALSKASLPSLSGHNIPSKLDAPLGGTLSSSVSVGGSERLTAVTSKPDGLLGVIRAQKAHHAQRAKSIGGMRTLFPTSNTASAYSTASQVVSGAVTTLKAKLTPTTEVGVFSYTNRGAQIGGSSYVTSYLLTGGTNQNVTSTASTILKGMNQAISASLLAVKTLVTNGQHVQCRQKSMTYDIAYAGPRNRYTVATDVGPIIVHNCGYGMGSSKFQAQLKNFGVELDSKTCTRIVYKYRDQFSQIPLLWAEGDKALKALIDTRTAPLGKHEALLVDMFGIKLPNGMYLRYDNLRKQRNTTKHKDEIIYDVKKGRATLPTHMYGGKLIENVCQALARIIIGEQMLMIARRYRVVMTVHDAVGVIAPIEEADKARAFVEACMRMRPKWAPTLPLNCESKIGASYGG